MQRNQKICKIIHEFTLYLLEFNSENIKIDVLQNKKQSIITFVTNQCSKEVKNFILSRIKGERDREIEQYGWQLMGEGSSDDDLEIINVLIDEISYEDKDNQTIIRMVRNE